MKLLSIFLLLYLFPIQSRGQSYYSNNTVPLAEEGTVSDTIIVNNLSQPILNENFGLDSVTVSINCPWSTNLIVSLVAPDGTMFHLSEQNGGIAGAHYINTCFDMEAPYLVSELSGPLTGPMRPDNNIGLANNGQNGNGIWQLRVHNKSSDWNAYIISWALHFNNTPAQPQFHSSNLPIVVINTNHASLSNHYWHADFKEKVNATLGIIDNGIGQTNYLSDTVNLDPGNIRIGVRGATSVGYPQLTYSIDMKNDNWEDTNVAMLGMPEEEDWVLYAPWNDKTLMRNALTFQLANDMGQYAPRTRFCELIFDGDYRGVYVLMENVKRGSNRVAVNKQDTDVIAAPQITGGYILQVDRTSMADSNSFQVAELPCQGAQTPTHVMYEYPRIENINQHQKQYIKRYVDSFAYALANIDYNDTINGYRNFIDVPSFIDFTLSQELANNVDAYRTSSYMYKKRNGKLYAGPVWDFNLAYGNAYYNASWGTDNYRWDQPCPDNTHFLIPFWWTALRQDTAYMREFHCRYARHRAGALNIAHIDALIDSMSTLLTQAQQRHFNRWPIMGRYIDPQIFIGQSFEEEVDYMKEWIHDRISFFDQEFNDQACPLSVGAIAENSRKGISIYPNPANEVLHIESQTKMADVTIYNMLGAELYRTQPAPGKLTIQLKSLAFAPGTYIVVATTGNETIRKKLLIVE